jgi:hypothetical protein
MFRAASNANTIIATNAPAPTSDAAVSTVVTSFQRRQGCPISPVLVSGALFRNWMLACCGAN